MPRAIVCHDDGGERRALVAILERARFEVAGVVDSLAGVLAAVVLLSPSVIVVDLTLTGDVGVNAVQVIRRACPGCAVVALTPFEALAPAAMAAGAYGVVADPHHDLSGFEECVGRLASALAEGGSTGAVSVVPAHCDTPGSALVTGDADGSRSTKAPPP